jgi:hypothetical protein
LSTNSKVEDLELAATASTDKAGNITLYNCTALYFPALNQGKPKSSLPMRSLNMNALSRGESEYSRQVALPSTITGDPLVV